MIHLFLLCNKLLKIIKNEDLDLKNRVLVRYIVRA